MKTIALTKGAVALVDDDDFDALSEKKWHLTSVGYAARSVMSSRVQSYVLMHRQIMAVSPGHEVDHVNRDPLDNRRANLRICTHAMNMWNRRANSGRAFKGVVRQRSIAPKVRAEIRSNGRKIHLGCFSTEIDAARAYDAAARELHGEFANLNFPDDTSQQVAV